MSEVEYTLCDECGALVPEANFAIHQARACGGRARASRPNNDDVIEIGEVSTSPATKRPNKSPTLFRSRQRPRIEKSDDEETDLVDVDVDGNDNDLSQMDNDIVNVGDVVDLTTSPPAAARANNDEWTCPKCTLLNQRSRPRCDACNYSNPEFRGPDATRTERLIDDFGLPSGNVNNSSSNNNTLRNLGGGALLGSLLGGAASYMRGRSVADGMVEGAVSGAVGGAIVDSMMRTPTRTSVTSARSGAAMGHPAYPSLTTTTRVASRQAPRASFQVRRQRVGGRNGRMVTTVIRSDGTTRFSGYDDPLMALMMSMGGAGYMQQHGDVDSMNYEQLLQAFGDGTENMGADEGAIAQFPVTAIEDPEKELPEDARQCCICLDDFCKGSQRKTLPCLHGFHEECIDRALRNRGCCPICNESVSL